MPSTQAEALLKMILGAMPGSANLDAAVEIVRDQLDVLAPGLALHRADDLAAAKELAAQQFEKIEVLHRHSVIRKRPQWYFGPKPRDFHWPALKTYITGVKQWAESDVTSIDGASTEVVSLLENPAQATQFSGRGLVVGHVQSGKTANMTAVIAKALDAGYNTVIVLAGLTNKLRHQTQLRLYHDLVCRNPMQWHLLTSNEIDKDFRAPPAGGFLSHTDKAQVAIVKKNVSPLSELKKAVAETIPLALSRLRVLVIDDECDQASVNSASGELEMTAINHRVRELLSLLPAVSYVGYTATPFANVLTSGFDRLVGVNRICPTIRQRIVKPVMVTRLPCPWLSAKSKRSRLRRLPWPELQRDFRSPYFVSLEQIDSEADDLLCGEIPFNLDSCVPNRKRAAKWRTVGAPTILTDAIARPSNDKRHLLPPKQARRVQPVHHFHKHACPGTHLRA